MAANRRPPRSSGNPPDSPWYSTPDADRGRPSLKITPAPETKDGLGALKERWGLGSLTAVVDWLVSQALLGRVPAPPGATVQPKAPAARKKLEPYSADSRTIF